MRNKTIKVYSPRGGELAPTTEKTASKMIARKKAYWVIKGESIKLRYMRYDFEKRKTKVIKEANRVCYICNTVIPENENPTIDHVTPKSKNGADTISNLRCCCKRCNDDKANRDIIEYIDHIKNNIKSYNYIDIKKLESDFLNKGV